MTLFNLRGVIFYSAIESMSASRMVSNEFVVNVGSMYGDIVTSHCVCIADDRVENVEKALTIVIRKDGTDLTLSSSTIRDISSLRLLCTADGVKKAMLRINNHTMRLEAERPQAWDKRFSDEDETNIANVVVHIVRELGAVYGKARLLQSPVRVGYVTATTGFVEQLMARINAALQESKCDLDKMRGLETEVLRVI